MTKIDIAFLISLFVAVGGAFCAGYGFRARKEIRSLKNYGLM